MKTKLVKQACYECGQTKEFTAYFMADSGQYETDTDAICESCADALSDAMGEDPCGKDWQA